MIYPKFLKPGDTIGICAPSRGIDAEDEGFDVSIEHLKSEGYNVIETENVRTGKLPSADAKTRAKELNELLNNDDIDFILSASGGDFLIELLPLIDENIINEIIKNNKAKWIAGYSDPTFLLFYLTTKFDIATMYGVNAGSFGMTKLYSNLQNALEMIKGQVKKQDSFTMYQRVSYEEIKNNGLNGYILTTPVEWKTPNGDVDITGRVIGGCIDCLKYLVGTKFDYVSDFIEKYKDDGIIWYFDNFALKVGDLYHVLFEMKHAGWFKEAKGFVFGRVLFEDNDFVMNYEEAIIRLLGNDIPIILEADIGHVKPTFSLINGAIGHFEASKGKGSLELFLK
jgi:muramoyltetrapeptide carboxypeptidase LdcA involved in peptidoglycan recycling